MFEDGTEHLIFLDESGVNTDMTRHDTHSKKKERFAEYLKTMLLPTLSKTDIIVIDDMRSHHAKIVKQVLDESGINYLYLPPYSPDLNPIEKM